MEEISLNPVCMNCGNVLDFDYYKGTIVRAYCLQCHPTPITINNSITPNCKCCCQPVAIDLDHKYILCSNPECISWSIVKEDNEGEGEDVYLLLYKNEVVLTYYIESKSIMMMTENGFLFIDNPDNFLVKLFYSVFSRVMGKEISELYKKEDIKVSKRAEKRKKK